MYPVGGPADTSLQPRDLNRFARQSSSFERLRAFLPPERKLERCFGRSSLLSVDSGFGTGRLLARQTAISSASSCG